MTKLEIETIRNLIELLTLNEDLKQDLWLQYLSGCPFHCLPDALCDLIYLEIDKDNPQFQSFIPLCTSIKYLPKYQRNIILLLYTGFKVESISEYQGISEVRIQQTLSSFYRKKV